MKSLWRASLSYSIFSSGSLVAVASKIAWFYFHKRLFHHYFLNLTAKATVLRQWINNHLSKILFLSVLMIYPYFLFCIYNFIKLIDFDSFSSCKLIRWWMSAANLFGMILQTFFDYAPVQCIQTNFWQSIPVL